MKEKIKEKAKKIIIPIFISILCGSICGRIVYKIYDDNNSLVLSNNIVYLLQAGAYSSYDNMKANTIHNNYIYYEDEGLYKAIIGITCNYDNINKIKEIYNGEIIVNQYLLNNNALKSKIVSLDKDLKIEEDKNKIRDIIDDMLDLYKEENITLTKIN